MPQEDNECIQLQDVRNKLDEIESGIVDELSKSGPDLLKTLPLLKDLENDLSVVTSHVGEIAEQITLLLQESKANQDEFNACITELNHVTEMIKLAQSVKQLLVSKSTAKAFMDEGDFQNAAAFLGSVLTDSKRLSSITTCGDLFAELSEMSLAVQKLLANSSSKPRHPE
jgi:hypothetical protein